jgi:hypothetical protein
MYNFETSNNNNQMINNIKRFSIMKLAQGIKSGVVAILAIGFLVGMAVFVRSVTKSEQTGYYTAQDTLNAYNHGAENMRQALKKEAQDLTVKSCQD